jgi:hypothetical protein
LERPNPAPDVDARAVIPIARKLSPMIGLIFDAREDGDAPGAILGGDRNDAGGVEKTSCR